eukprot:CAMPEP_0182481532 /NCGR_PEP_ID=MMETSP1319-20130603/37492_1 /TAXON_ID=172717 /ORGANISM="Bolidomonas pacifica, Strain RCC208" /LENGTH=157 /DNA_ID=CAMNT_0024683147 /DNA_START=149 /DNA_END=618 /DNA_ORIENTATION=-
MGDNSEGGGDDSSLRSPLATGQSLTYPLPTSITSSIGNAATLSLPAIVTCLLENSVRSLDDNYFSAARSGKSSRRRGMSKREQTIVIELSASSLTLTDHGTGLTKPDIVNCLCSSNGSNTAGGFWLSALGSKSVALQCKSVHDGFYTVKYKGGDDSV